MKSKQIFSFIVLMLFLSPQLHAQTYTWKPKASTAASPTAGVSAFAINNKGYIFGGFDSTFVTTKEIWEYDNLTDTWTQKASFPGLSRVSAPGFSIGNEGYVCGGWTGTSPGGPYTPLNDLWQYNPINDSWTQKASFPSYGRYNSSVFVIDSKAYFGLGYAPISNDFYEYESLTDQWTPLSDTFPGVARTNAMAFTITYIDQGNTVTKGFVGGGASADNTTSQLNDFYSFTPGITPGSGVWTPVSPIPVGRYAGFAFTINDKAYVGCGIANGNYLNDFYEYNPATDTWTALQNYPVNMAAVKGFSIGNNGYAGTGTDGITNLTDFYEWSPGVAGVGESETEDFSLFVRKDELQIMLTAVAASTTPVYIYNISGQLIESGEIKAGSAATRLDIAQLEAGTYIVGVYLNNETLRSVKLVLTR